MMKWIRILALLQLFAFNNVCQSFVFDRWLGNYRLRLSPLSLENDEIDIGKSKTRSSIFRKKKKNEKQITLDQSKEKKEGTFDFLSDEDREILAKYNRSEEGNMRFVAGFDDDEAWKALAIQHFGFIEVPGDDETPYACNNETFDKMVEQTKLEIKEREERLLAIQREINGKDFQKEVQKLNPTSFLTFFSPQDYGKPLTAMNSVNTWSNDSDVINFLASFLHDEFLYPAGTMNEDLPRPIFVQLKELCQVMKTWKLGDVLPHSLTDPSVNIDNLANQKDLTFHSPTQVQSTFLSIFSSIFARYHLQVTTTMKKDASNTSTKIPDPFLSMKLGILKQSLPFYEMIIPRYFELLDHSMEEEENSRNLFLQRLQQLLTFLSRPSQQQREYQLYMSRVTDEVLSGPDEDKLTKRRRQERRFQAFLDYLNQEIPLSSLTNTKAIPSLGISSKRLHWFLSPFHEKMVADFLIIHALLSSNIVDEIVLHVLPSYENQQSQRKYFPFFNSLPSEDDVLLFLDFFGNPTSSDIWTIRNFGNQLKQFYFDGKLCVLPSDQWKREEKKEEIIETIVKNESDAIIIRNREQLQDLLLLASSDKFIDLFSNEI